MNVSFTDGTKFEDISKVRHSVFWAHVDHLYFRSLYSLHAILSHGEIREDGHCFVLCEALLSSTCTFLWKNTRNSQSMPDDRRSGSSGLCCRYVILCNFKVLG